MQYENKILNFHIYLYFPSNIFKKFKNIKIKGLTYYILTVAGSIPVSRSVRQQKGLPNGKSFFVIREVRGTSRNPTASQFGFDFSER